MTLAEFNRVCEALPHTHHVIQWGGSHVWKVGGATGKMFAIGSFAEGGALQITFKCSAMSYDLLRTQPGLRPAPYLASRGMMWIQRTSRASMRDAALRDYLSASYQLASRNLTKAAQRRLGLNQPDAPVIAPPPARRRVKKTPQVL